VELNPQNGGYVNTLGVAYYRTGDWKAAIAALEKSMELRKGGDSLDWFFLAMAHWQLGNKDEARRWYDKAVKWMEEHAPKNVELTRFRAEAAELLGVRDHQARPASSLPPPGTTLPTTAVSRPAGARPP
jgi:eukaryotic-like serine/threonine-protein kinase